MSRAWAWEGLGRPGGESQALSPSSQPRLRLRPGLAGLRAVLSARAEGVVRITRAQRGSQTCPHTPAPPRPAATPAWNTSPCVLPHPFCSSKLISQIKSLRGSPLHMKESQYFHSCPQDLDLAHLPLGLLSKYHPLHSLHLLILGDVRHTCPFPRLCLLSPSLNLPVLGQIPFSHQTLLLHCQPLIPSKVLPSPLPVTRVSYFSVIREERVY